MKTSTVTALAVGTGALCLVGIVGIVAQADTVTEQDVAQVVDTQEQRNKDMDRKPVEVHTNTVNNESLNDRFNRGSRDDQDFPPAKPKKHPLDEKKSKGGAPKGFKHVYDGVYLKWGGAPSYGTGTSFKIWTARGCDTLYIEGNWMDSNGTIVDYSNELINNLPPKTKAKGEFVTFANSAKTVQVTEVTCY